MSLAGRLLRALPPLLVLAAAGAAGVAVHEMNLEPRGVTKTRPSGKTSILGSAERFAFRKVDPLDGRLLWEARGVTATPEGDSGWTIQEPLVVIYQLEGRVVTPTTIEGRRARALFSPVADATVRLEDGVTARRGALTLEAMDLAAVLPQGRRRDETARLSTERPVRLSQPAPVVDARGSGLRADGALRALVLAPPVEVLLDPAALEGSLRPPGPERLRLLTSAPVEVTESESDHYEIRFTGPVSGSYQRAAAHVAGGAAGGGGGEGAPLVETPLPLLGTAPSGGSIRVRKPDAKRDPGATLRAAESARFRDAELREGEELVARGADLAWDGARGVAVLEGDALLRDPSEGSVVRARRIEYHADAAGASATLTGDVRASVETPTYTALVRAERAEVAFGPRAVTHAAHQVPAGATPAADAIARHAPSGATRAADAIVPGPLLSIRAAGDVTGDFFPITGTAAARSTGAGPSTGAAPRVSAARAPGAPTTTARAAPSLDDERAAALESVWHLEADEAVIGLGRDARGEREVGSIALSGVGRQALLRSESTDPERCYRIEGDRIEADRVRGTAAVRPAPGTLSRQTLERGPYRVEAREARFDERAREARASGEAILSKMHPSREIALRAEAQEALLRFSIPDAPSRAAAGGASSATAPAKGAPGGLGAPAGERVGRPESFVLSGPGGVRARIVPELLSATATPVPPAERHPVAITAARVTGEFGADERGRPALASVLAEGAPGAPVEVAPDYDAPREERFRLIAEGARYDAARDEVRLLGAEPLFSRGDERVTARSARFHVSTLEGFLEEGVRGRVFMRLSEEKEDRLVDFSSERARVRLAEGVAGAGAISEVDADGKLRLYTSDGAVDVTGDALRLRRERDERIVRLSGRPLTGHWGLNEIAGESVRLVLPPEQKDKRSDAKKPGDPAASLGRKEE